jgi:hypothetical protein
MKHKILVRRFGSFVKLPNKMPDHIKIDNRLGQPIGKDCVICRKPHGFVCHDDKGVVYGCRCTTDYCSCSDCTGGDYSGLKYDWQHLVDEKLWVISKGKKLIRELKNGV